MASRLTAPTGPSPRRKLVMAASPRMRRAAASYASAASSAVSNVPSHRRDPCGHGERAVRTWPSHAVPIIPSRRRCAGTKVG